MLIRISLFLAFSIVLSSCADTSNRNQNFLINEKTSSPILEISVSGTEAGCASSELHFAIDQEADIDVELCNQGQCVRTEFGKLNFSDRSTSVHPNDITIGSGDATQGPVIPVEGPDGLTWLCREDEEAAECICIPWFQ